MPVSITSSDLPARPRQATGKRLASTIFSGLPANAREAAGKLLQELMLSEQTINLSSLVHHFADCDLLEVDIEGDGYCLPAGMLSDKTLVVIPSNGQNERRRFTLAHELGHLACHYQDDREFIGEEERWCDTFASELLMPRARVEAFERTVGTLADWLKFPGRFQVSRWAAARQLWEYCGVVMTSERLNAVRGDARYDAVRAELLALARATDGPKDRYRNLSDGTECLLSWPTGMGSIAIARIQPPHR
jgi:hypothetical protein